MQSAENNLDDFEQEPEIRPMLLTVLCILTFIGSGWLILSNAWSYSMAPKTSRMLTSVISQAKKDSSSNTDSLNNQRHQKKHSEFGEKLMVSVSAMMTEDNIKKSAAGSVVSGLLTLVGALLMWWQKRNGYYLYIAGIIIGIIVPFYLYGNNLLAVGMSTFSSFFGLVFIALYALNIKSMNN